MSKTISGLICGIAFLGSSSIAGATEAWTYSKDGSACAVSIDTGGGQTWAIGCDPDSEGNGTTWQRTSSGWTFVPGMRGKQIRVSNQGAVWLLKDTAGTSNNLYKRVGNAWTPFTFCALSVDVGNADTDAWAVQCGTGSGNQRIFRFNGTTWSEPQPAARARQIAVGADNVPWVRPQDGSIWRWNGSAFTAVSGCAANTAPGGSFGAGVVVGCDSRSIWRWDGSQFLFMWSVNPAAISFMATDGSFYTDFVNGQVYRRTITIIQ